MTVIEKAMQGFVNNPTGLFSGENVAKILSAFLPAEEQQIRDAWSISANREYLGIDLETYLTKLKTNP